LEQDLGRSPTSTELAKVLPFKQREIDRLRQYEAKDTLKTYQESDLPVDANKDVVAEEIFSRHQLHDLLELLPELHRRVLELRYLEDAPLNFISKEIKLSEGRVSQLHTEAIEMLRDHILLSDLAA
jgi:RNA polymerase sigma factor for flagellar operon FliA